MKDYVVINKVEAFIFKNGEKIKAELFKCKQCKIFYVREIGSLKKFCSDYCKRKNKKVNKYV